MTAKWGSSEREKKIEARFHNSNGSSLPFTLLEAIINIVVSQLALVRCSWLNVLHSSHLGAYFWGEAMSEGEC